MYFSPIFTFAPSLVSVTSDTFVNVFVMLASGICAFVFEFYPASQSNSWKYLYDKGFEPAKVGWNGTKENLYAGNAWACDKTGNTIDSRAYCAALIQYNGWKIPKDFPVKIKY